jgi:transposase
MLGMNDTSLYASILGVSAPWKVTSVTPALDEGEIVVRVEAPSSMKLACPECQTKCPRHDHRMRRWRHLPTCQYRTILEVEVPRVSCAEHGVHQVPVPWAEANSAFTALLEALVISWLKEASLSAVAGLMDLTWDQVDGIMQRAVRRGLARRQGLEPERIGVDETSFQKRHEYVTVVTDLDTKDVLYVADKRTKDSLQGFFDELEPADLLRLKVISMDMWPAYISVVEENVHDAEKKICFDKFHVAKYLGDAVNKVRRKEQQEQVKVGDRSLVGTKYTWLRNPENMEADSAGFFERMKRVALRTARAWALKEQAMCLWHYASRGWARKAWKAWISWALRSRLEPMKRVARMVRSHLEGIINAIVLKATNAASESINARIQHVKRMACGFRNRERFRNAIYFHLGGLDLSPATHTRP